MVLYLRMLVSLGGACTCLFILASAWTTANEPPLYSAVGWWITLVSMFLVAVGAACVAWWAWPGRSRHDAARGGRRHPEA